MNFKYIILLGFLSCCKPELNPPTITPVTEVVIIDTPVVKPIDTIYTAFSAGQSNMNGWTKQAFPYANMNNDVQGIKMFNWQNRTIETFNYKANSGGENPPLGYWSADHVVYKYVYDSIYHKSKDVIAFKVTKGGTSLHPKGMSHGSWNVHTDSVVGAKMFDSLVNRFNDFKALYPNKYIKVEYLIWHQGESDYIFQKGYYARMKSLFDSIRVVVGNPNLVVIMGTVSSQSKAFSASIRDQILALAANEPRLYRAIDLTDVPISADVTHFNAAGQMEFAKRIIPHVKEIIKN